MKWLHPHNTAFSFNKERGAVPTFCLVLWLHLSLWRPGQNVTNRNAAGVLYDDVDLFFKNITIYTQVLLKIHLLQCGALDRGTQQCALPWMRRFSWYWMMKYSWLCCNFLSSFSVSCVARRSSSKAWLICWWRCDRLSMACPPLPQVAYTKHLERSQCCLLLINFSIFPLVGLTNTHTCDVMIPKSTVRYHHM